MSKDHNQKNYTIQVILAASLLANGYAFGVISQHSKMPPRYEMGALMIVPVRHVALWKI